jgi:outer membrane receptor protein involved in Fe transport
VDAIKNLGIGLIDPPQAAWGTPSVSITGFSGFGDSVQGPFVINDHTFQWTDNLSWVRGRHSLKFGAEIRRDQFNQSGNQDPRGALAIQNQATGYGFADYMLGYAEQTQDAAGLAIAQYRSTSQAYFINDYWKLCPNLTIDVGLRYEYTPAVGDEERYRDEYLVPAALYGAARVAFVFCSPRECPMALRATKSNENGRERATIGSGGERPRSFPLWRS